MCTSVTLVPILGKEDNTVGTRKVLCVRIKYKRRIWLLSVGKNVCMLVDLSKMFFRYTPDEGWSGEKGWF